MAMIFCMDSLAHPPDNNSRLRQLVQRSGLAPAVALTIFNRGRAAAPCTESEWRGYLADPAQAGFRPLSTELLAHAELQFSLLEATR